jgi:hypothetical protein
MKKKISLVLVAGISLFIIGWWLAYSLYNKEDKLEIHNLYTKARKAILSGDVEAIHAVLAPEYQKNHTTDDTVSLYRNSKYTWIEPEDWTVRLENYRNSSCGPTAWIVGQKPEPEYTNASRYAYYAPKSIGIWSSGVEFEFIEINGKWVCSGDWILYYD